MCSVLLFNMDMDAVGGAVPGVGVIVVGIGSRYCGKMGRGIMVVDRRYAFQKLMLGAIPDGSRDEALNGRGV